MLQYELFFSGNPEVSSVEVPALQKAVPTQEMLQSNVSPSWAATYVIPWSKLPQRGLMDCLEKGVRPKPSLRREMIRVIASDLSNITLKPGKKTLSLVVQKIVEKYPKSFQDEIEGSVVGTGFDSLLKQFVVRFENLVRKSSEGANKRKRDDPSTASDAMNKKKNFDTYGCINYLPTDFPPGETAETLKEMKNLLKEKYLYNPSEEIEELMNLTYILQRKDILETDASIMDLRKEWPFLFEQSGMFTHFEVLTGIKLPQNLENSMTKKSEHIMKWMK